VHVSILEALCRLRLCRAQGLVRNIGLQRLEANELQEVETCLEDLAHPDDPLVRVIPTQPGQNRRKNGYVQLLSGKPELDVSAASPAPTLESVSDMSHLRHARKRIESAAAKRGRFKLVQNFHSGPVARSYRPPTTCRRFCLIRSARTSSELRKVSTLRRAFSRIALLSRSEPVSLLSLPFHSRVSSLLKGLGCSLRSTIKKPGLCNAVR
jgi:hypothetical protein